MPLKYIKTSFLKNLAEINKAEEPMDKLISLLNQELEARCQRNPRYSLRSFARFLGVNHTSLSLILSGKRSPSSDFINRVSRNLQISAFEKQEIEQGSKIFRAKKMVGEWNLNQLGDGFKKMSLEDIALINEWYYY